MNPLLPKVCAVHHPDGGRMVLVFQDKPGYWEVHPGGTLLTVEQFNALIGGVTQDQMTAMLAGSLFGWNCKAVVEFKPKLTDTHKPCLIMPRLDWIRCHKCKAVFEAFWPGEQADVTKRPFCPCCKKQDQTAPVADDTALEQARRN